MATLSLRDIEFQDNLRSKPVRDNFTDIASYANNLQDQIDAMVSTGTLAEVVNARDYASTLQNRLRGASKLTGNALITGGAVLANSPADMRVSISKGTALIDGVYCSWATAISGTLTAPTTNPRYDAVVINSDNTRSIITGTEDPSPVVPSWSTSQKIVASLYLTAGTTSITNTYISQYDGIESINVDTINVDTINVDTIEGNVNLTGTLTGNLNADTISAININENSSASELPPIGSIIGVHPEVKNTLGLDTSIWSPCDGVADLPSANFTLATATKVPDLTDERFLIGSSAYGIGGSNTINITHNHVWYDLFVRVTGGSDHHFRDGQGTDLGVGDVSSYLSGTMWAIASNNADGTYTGFGTLGGDAPVTGPVGFTYKSQKYYTDNKLSSSQSIIPQYFKVKYYIRIK